MGVAAVLEAAVAVKTNTLSASARAHGGEAERPATVVNAVGEAITVVVLAGKDTAAAVDGTAEQLGSAIATVAGDDAVVTIEAVVTSAAITPITKEVDSATAAVMVMGDTAAIVAVMVVVGGATTPAQTSPEALRFRSSAVVGSKEPSSVATSGATTVLEVAVAVKMNGWSSATFNRALCGPAGERAAASVTVTVVLVMALGDVAGVVGSANVEAAKHVGMATANGPTVVVVVGGGDGKTSATASIVVLVDDASTAADVVAVLVNDVSAADVMCGTATAAPVAGNAVAVVVAHDAEGTSCGRGAAAEDPVRTAAADSAPRRRAVL